jgi:hypothetical protein
MFVITDQNSSALREPTQRSLDNPAAGFVALFPITRFFLFANAADVGSMAPGDRRLPARGIVIAFVQAKVLRRGPCWLRPFDDYRLNGRFQEFTVWDIGSLDDRSQRATMLIDQQAGLGARLAAIRGIFPNLFPPQSVPCPGVRRHSAIPRRHRLTHHRFRPIAPTKFQRYRPGKTAGTNDARYYRYQSSRGACSTDSRYACGR